MEIADADFNMRRKFYEESEEFTERSRKEEKKAAIGSKCPKCGFIATTNIDWCS